ncbi:Lipopolysaccharide assembly protein A [subsurface metagenome]|jgi:uncharacterized integral membrane protein
MKKLRILEEKTVETNVGTQRKFADSKIELSPFSIFKENKERSMICMQLQLIVAIIVAILAVVFALQNAVPITVSFLTWRFESSLALVLLIVLALGILMSLLVSVPSMIRTRKIISNQKKKIQKLEIGLQKEAENKVKEEIESEESELPLE